MKKLKYYKKEKEIRKSVYSRGNISENNKSYAILLHNTGVYYEKINNKQKSLPLKMESQTIKKALDGKNSVSYAYGMFNIAYTFMLIRQYEKAE